MRKTKKIHRTTVEQPLEQLHKSEKTIGAVYIVLKHFVLDRFSRLVTKEKKSVKDFRTFLLSVEDKKKY